MLIVLLLVVAILAMLYVAASSSFFANKPSSQSKRSKPQISEKALIKRIQKVVESGGNIDASQNNDKQTMLHIAAKYGCREAAVLCLDKGADIESLDYTGMTPLLQAAHDGHVAVVELLVERGANIEARAMFGWTPLIWSVYAGEPNVVKLLIKNGADINAQGTMGLTPLSIASGEIANILRSHGAKRGSEL